MTNREWLMSLTDRELTRFLDNDATGACAEFRKCVEKIDAEGFEAVPDEDCENCGIRWLNAEHREAEI